MRIIYYIISLCFLNCSSFNQKDWNESILNKLKQAAVDIQRHEYSGKKDFGKKFLDQNEMEIQSLVPRNWGDARVAMDSLRRIFFYTNDSRISSKMEDLYWFLDIDKFIRDEDHKLVYEAYLITRQFDKAKKFRGRLHKMRAKDLSVVQINDANLNLKKPNLMNILSETQLMIQQFPINEFSGILIIASLNCYWSISALEELSSKKGQLDLKSNEIIVLAPQRDKDLVSMNKWNKKHPSLPLHLVYDEALYADLDFNNVPKFYFYKSGTIVDSISGWNPDENPMNSFLKSLRKIH